MRSDTIKDTSMYEMQQIQIRSSKERLIPMEQGAWMLQLCWLFVLTMLVRSALFIRQHYGSDYTSIDIYNLVNIVATFAIAVILVIRFQEVVPAVREAGTAVWYIVFYYVVCAVVGLWSPSPEYSTFRVLEYLACFWAIMLMLRRSSNFLKAERLALLCMSISLALEIGGQIRLGGWGAFDTNRYSVTAAMLVGYSFGELSSATGRRKRFLVITLVMGLGGVLLGTSTGSNLALVGGLIVLFILSPRHGRYILFALPALLLVGSWDHFLGILLGGKSLEQVVSLSNRMGIWVNSWNLFIQRPLLGYGLNIASRHYSHMVSSHNTYLEALLGGGILGAGVLLFGCLFILRDLRRSVKRHATGSLGCCVATVVFLINGMSIPTIGFILAPHTIAFAFMLAMFVYHVRCPAERSLEPLDIPSAQWSRIPRLYVNSKTPESSTEVP